MLVVPVVVVVPILVGDLKNTLTRAITCDAVLTEIPLDSVFCVYGGFPALPEVAMVAVTTSVNRPGLKREVVCTHKRSGNSDDRLKPPGG
jgi:hypothetical protein